MKLIYKLVIACVIITSSLSINAQDSLYIYKDGIVIDKHKLAEVDSVIFYKAEVPEENIVTDIDGNVYNTVVIGTQIWMAENLKTTSYNDGTIIPNVTNNAEWGSLTSGAYCWYNNNEGTYKEAYGALYNWYVVDETSNGGKNVCPTGWHVPVDAEWTTLIDYIISDGYSGAEGTALKAISGWNTNSGTDNYGFKALPSGYNEGATLGFGGIGEEGSWWSATEDSPGWALMQFLNDNLSSVTKTFSGMYYGYSVRCIKD